MWNLILKWCFALHIRFNKLLGFYFSHVEEFSGHMLILSNGSVARSNLRLKGPTMNCLTKEP